MRIRFALSAMLFVFAQAVSAAEPRQPASATLKPPQRSAASSPITDRFALRISYYPSSIETQVRLDGDGNIGTDLLAEDDLGLDDRSDEARAELLLRINERNRLRVDYLKLSRFGDVTLDRTINFGDEVFNVNDRAQTGLEWRQLTFTYTRSLLRRDRFELGAGLGVSILEAKARGQVIARNIREMQDGVGAFPTLAVDGTWRISKRWALSARAQRLTATVDEFRGSMADYHADIQYRWRSNFAVGLGYTRLRALVDVGEGDEPGDDDLTGRFNQTLSGPEIFIRASF